jgi:DNA-3-methyladenine glycosylase
MKLPVDFYTNPDVVENARTLLGKILVTEFGGLRTSGRIIETEAYRAPEDQASHARNNRRTARTEVMFWEGGHAYVYLCYGIHHLFNVVTGPAGSAHAVLVRAVEPLEGIETMRLRRGKHLKNGATAIVGPGALSQALGLHTRLSGQNMLLSDSPVWIEDAPSVPDENILAGKRIGIDYAGAWAEVPWRFQAISAENTKNTQWKI